MTARRLRVVACVMAIVVSSCDATSSTEFEIATSPTTIAAIEFEATTTTETDSSDAVGPQADADLAVIGDGGCNRFDPVELGRLTDLSVPLSLVSEQTGSGDLRCSLLGVADGRDVGALIVIGRVADQGEDFYRSAGQFESPITIAGREGVATGRGSLRAQLNEEFGVVLSIALRTLSSDVTPYTDEQHLDIRDAVAEYVLSSLAEATG